MASKFDRKKHSEVHKEMLNKYKNNPQVHSKIKDIIKLCKNSNEDELFTFIILYQNLEDPQIGVKEISLYEISIRGIPHTSHESFLLDLQQKFISILSEKSTNEEMKASSNMSNRCIY